MMRNVYILGVVESDSYSSMESVYSIIEELTVTGVNGICFSVHTDEDTNLAPFDIKQWGAIKHYCDALNMEFIGRPRALGAVECLEELGVNRYRIAAEEVGNFPLLEMAARTGKDLILSAPPGMDWQVERMVDFIQPYENNLVMMQWMPFYPCQPWDWGLTRLEWLKDHFGYRVGLCDRSGDLYAGVAAVALGAEFIEFKVKDYTAEMRKKLVDGIRKVESSLQIHPQQEEYSLKVAYKEMFERSLVFNKDKRKGARISLDDIEITNNGNGIDVSRYYDIVGKYLCSDVKKGEMLSWSVLQHDCELG
ncbi:MAG: N-acetylneuraminate synthase family protein [Bacteroidales bacterium]